MEVPFRSSPLSDVTRSSPRLGSGSGAKELEPTGADHPVPVSCWREGAIPRGDTRCIMFLNSAHKTESSAPLAGRDLPNVKAGITSFTLITSL